MSSELEELTKLPAESILFDMEFDLRMVTGETIVSVDATVSTNQARVTGSTALTLGSTSFAGTIAQVRISAGTSNEQYEIAITITTTLSNIRVGKGMLRVL